MSNWEILNSTLPEESLATQEQELAVALKLFAKMGITPQEDLTSPKSETSLPYQSVLIIPKNAGRDLGTLSLFAHEGDDRPMTYMVELPEIGVRRNSPEYFIHGILQSYLISRRPQFQIISDAEDDLTAIKIAMSPRRYSQYEVIGDGDMAVGLIFYSPQLVTTSLGQPLIVGTVGFLTLPTESSRPHLE